MRLKSSKTFLICQKKKANEIIQQNEIKDLTEQYPVDKNNTTNSGIAKKSVEENTVDIKKTEETNSEEKSVKTGDIYADVSDTARMIIDLFDGKIVD